jgi:hypothetical protein
MGNFYANLTLQGTSADAVVRELSAAGRNAFVSQESRGLVMVFDEGCDTQDVQQLSDLASSLSRSLDCVALGVLNHDDDVFYFELWDRGEQKDEYNSNPAYFAGESDEDAGDELLPDDEEGPVEDDESDDSGPAGGDAFALALAFGVPDKQAAIGELLAHPEAFTFAFELHLELCELLGIPGDPAICGFNTLQMGELMPGMSPEHLIRVGID